jgi:excisionase family DNA binding protein
MQTVPQAMSIPVFCQTYGIGRSSVYEEIGAGRLPIKKAGRRTLITRKDADAWLERLPSGGNHAA